MTVGSQPGRLFAVVGPSGVGKDSVMAALARARPGLGIVRRVITRPVMPGAEDHETLNDTDFEMAVSAGAFCLHWQAHGLRYGVPAETVRKVEEGADLLVNLSRSALGQAVAIFPHVTILSVTARPETLASRLAGRGRETEADIARRLARRAPVFPAAARVVTLSNDGPLEQTVDAALDALYAERQ